MSNKDNNNKCDTPWANCCITCAFSEGSVQPAHPSICIICSVPRWWHEAFTNPRLLTEEIITTYPAECLHWLIYTITSYRTQKTSCFFLLLHLIKLFTFTTPRNYKPLHSPLPYFAQSCIWLITVVMLHIIFLLEHNLSKITFFFLFKKIMFFK